MNVFKKRCKDKYNYSAIRKDFSFFRFFTTVLNSGFIILKTNNLKENAKISHSSLWQKKTRPSYPSVTHAI